MAPHELFVPRRVGVCGSSKDLPPEAVLFCEAVGEQLANQSNVVIVSGGSRWREGASEDNLAADWHIVNAAAEQVRRISGAEQVEQRIETVVGDQLQKAHTSTSVHPVELAARLVRRAGFRSYGA